MCTCGRKNDWIAVEDVVEVIVVDEARHEGTPPGLAVHLSLDLGNVQAESAGHWPGHSGARGAGALAQLASRVGSG